MEEEKESAIEIEFDPIEWIINADNILMIEPREPDELKIHFVGDVIKHVKVRHPQGAAYNLRDLIERPAVKYKPEKK